MILPAQLKDRVKKAGGDYTFEGVVVAMFNKRGGEVRYVIEDDRGILLIMNPRQIIKVDPTEMDYAAVERRIVAQTNPDWAERPQDQGRLVPRDPESGPQSPTGRKSRPPEAQTLVPRASFGDSVRMSDVCPHCGWRHPPDGVCV